MPTPLSRGRTPQACCRAAYQGEGSTAQGALLGPSPCSSLVPCNKARHKGHRQGGLLLLRIRLGRGRARDRRKWRGMFLARRERLLAVLGASMDTRRGGFPHRIKGLTRRQTSRGWHRLAVRLSLMGLSTVDPPMRPSMPSQAPSKGKGKGSTHKFRCTNSLHSNLLGGRTFSSLHLAPHNDACASFCMPVIIGCFELYQASV